MDSGELIRFIDVILGWASSYSLGNPSLPNTNQNQNFLSDKWRQTVLDWFDGTKDNLDEKELNKVIPRDQFSEMINPDIYDMIMTAYATEGIENTCDLAKEGATDKFCEAIAKNDLKEQVARTKHLTNLCWTPADEIFRYDGHVPSMWKRVMNPKLKLWTVPGLTEGNGLEGLEIKANNHGNAGGVCTLLFGFLFLRRFY